jgi:hypothetical protein
MLDGNKYPDINWYVGNNVSDCGVHSKLVSNSSTNGEIDIYFHSQTTVTSTEDTYNKNVNIEVYPNPNNGNFTVGFSNPDNKFVDLSITDLMGKTVIKTSTNQNSYQFNGNKLKDGLYLLTITKQEQNLVLKFVVK